MGGGKWTNLSHLCDKPISAQIFALLYLPTRIEFLIWQLNVWGDGQFCRLREHGKVIPFTQTWVGTSKKCYYYCHDDIDLLCMSITSPSSIIFRMRIVPGLTDCLPVFIDLVPFLSKLSILASALFHAQSKPFSNRVCMQHPGTFCFRLTTCSACIERADHCSWCHGLSRCIDTASSMSFGIYGQCVAVIGRCGGCLL